MTAIPTAHVPTVYDKTNLVELATQLHANGVELISTGSTAATIAAAGIPVTPVEQVTGFPECLEGRVKTLHPKIHAGILADRRKDAHLAQLRELQVAPIDLVVVNLYPFTDTVASGADFDACVEQIDIGGPSMVRAAAKNHPAVAVVVDPARYEQVAQAVSAGGFTLSQRRALAAAAFAHTASYDVAVASWFSQQLETEAALPEFVGATFTRAHALRYGENPHQSAALYTQGQAQGIAGAEQLHGKAMSYNNYTDADAAVRAAYDQGEATTVVVVKHANPCGIAVDEDVAKAHAKAHACDPVSAYGGVIATNATVTAAMAAQVKPIFTEVIVAPEYEPQALEILSAKKNLRILRLPKPVRGGYEFKQVTGGLLVQERDNVDATGDDPAQWQLVAGPSADAETLADLRFAWNAVRSVRSNAVLLAHAGATVGVGMGQVNRVDSCKLAIERANTLGARATGDAAANQANSAGGADASQILATSAPQRAVGSVAASDAFFPFADGLQLLIDAGVKAVVQPGGSIRDAEVIEAAQAAGVTMYFTGTRHFAH